MVRSGKLSAKHLRKYNLRLGQKQMWEEKSEKKHPYTSFSNLKTIFNSPPVRFSLLFSSYNLFLLMLRTEKQERIGNLQYRGSHWLSGTPSCFGPVRRRSPFRHQHRHYSKTYFISSSLYSNLTFPLLQLQLTTNHVSNLRRS